MVYLIPIAAPALGILVFLAVRYLVARSLGIRELSAALGLDNGPWAMTSLGKRLWFGLAGPLGWYLFCVALFTSGQLVAGTQIVDVSQGLEIVPGSPAERAGMRSGDSIVSVAGRRIDAWEQLVQELPKHAGQSISVVVKRHGAELPLVATVSSEGRLGVTPHMVRGEISLSKALGSSITTPAELWYARLRSFFYPGELGGPIRIGSRIAPTQDFADYLMLGGVSASYSVLLPIVFAFAAFPRRKHQRSRKS